MVKYLVTGGAGFIGSHLVEKLVQLEHEVYVLDDLSSGSLNNLKHIKGKWRDASERYEYLPKDAVHLKDEHGICEPQRENLVSSKLYFTRGSILDRDLVRSLTEKTDVIFHLATQCLVKGLEDPLLMHQVNDIGTFNICVAAKEFDSKIVYVGTSEMYGPQETLPISESAPLNPVSIYGQTKIVAEQYVRFFNKIYDVPAVCLRPFNTFGPRQREDGYAGVITSFIKKAEKNEPYIIYGDGYQTRDFSYVTDIVDGIIFFSELENGEVINLGSETETSVQRIAELISKYWGKTNIFTIEDPRINDLRHLRADTTLARTFGYKQKKSFEGGLKEYVEWWKKKSINNGK